MASKKSLFSRIFGKREYQEEAEQGQETAPLQQEAEPEPEAAPPSSMTLTLTPTPPLVTQLWTLCSQQQEGVSRPFLVLEDVPPMDDFDSQNLLYQLQVVLNAASKRRIDAMQPKTRPNEEPKVPNLDAQAVVFVPRDGLAAWILLFPPSGEGAHADGVTVDEALDKAQVRYGLDHASLSSIPKHPQRYFRLFRAARGVPPEHGQDGRIMDLFPRSKERNLKADDNNRVDYASLNVRHNVQAGEVICRIIAPTEGIPGRSVLDKEIDARDGRPAAVPKGRNTRINDEGDALVATLAGEVEFSGRGFQVKPILEVPGNVDFSTGNINFVGDIIIHGDICAGFTVRSMGNITVDGVVEACTVEAGGDLTVARGVQGDNQAVIRAHRNVYAKYLENCCVCAKEALYSDCIINCDVYCDGTVEVRSGRMTVIGGNIRAGKIVNAGIIGSRTETKTFVFLGGLPCGDFDYGVLTQEAGELRDELERLAKQPDSPQKLTRMSKVKVKLLASRKKMEELDKEREKEQESEEAGEEDDSVCRMRCDTVYPGTSLTIRGVNYQFNRMYTPCDAKLVDGIIQLI